MSDSSAASALPDRPDLDQLRKQAKDALASGVHPTLSAAQLAIARQYGYASWAKLKRAVELRTLYRLITEGDAGPVRALLDDSPSLVGEAFDDGETPLHLAAGENRPEIIELLVARGASFGSVLGGSAHTALSWAATSGSFDAGRALVRLGATPDLFSAAGLGLLDVVAGFWVDGRVRPRPSTTGSSRYDANGARLPCPPERDEDAVSDALYVACRNGQLDVSRWLVEHGADPNWRGFAGATCLAWAEYSGVAELTAALRAHGGRDDLLDAQYKAEPRVFAVMVYAGWGFGRKLAARLARDPAAAHLRGGRGTVLHAAAEAGQLSCVRMLLAAGADRTVPNPTGQTAYDVATAKGFATVAELLHV